MSDSYPRVFVFPGQGSQSVGMGRELAESSAAARAVFDEADRTLGFPLSEMCWEGPEDALDLTANTQPALVAVSIAALRAIEEESPSLEPVAVAGHSLGEYSALVAAGILDFSDALRLVRRRGELMQEAVPIGAGAMAAILGLPGGEVERLVEAAAQDQVCEVANYNSPEQTVIAGDVEAVERAVAMAGDFGARKAVPLPVSAPFHCSLMAPARKAMQPLLEEVEFREPRLPVVSNVDARPHRSGSGARDALVRQIDSPVRWVESVEALSRVLGPDAAGASNFVEVGPGRVLSGLLRQILGTGRPLAVSSPDGVLKLTASG